MDGYQSPDLNAPEVDGVSRRQVLMRIGAGGFATTLVFQKLEAAYAQDATPAADSGPPEGIEVSAVGGGIPIPDLPTEPFAIQVARLTLEPGADTGLSSSPYPSMAYVEAGEGLICPPAGEGRFVYGPDGEVIASGAGEFPFPLGTWCYTAPDTMDGVRNDGDEQASVLLIELVPTEE